MTRGKRIHPKCPSQSLASDAPHEEHFWSRLWFGIPRQESTTSFGLLMDGITDKVVISSLVKRLN